MCPVSFYGAIAGLFRALNRQRGNEAVPKPTNANGGRGKRLPPRAKAKGQSRMVPPGGFLRGEQFERERVVPPLSRLLCFLSCRSKKGRPRWQALAESRLENRLKGYNWMSTTTSKYHPISKPELHRPLAPSVTCGDSSLPEGAIFRQLLRLHIGFWRIGSDCCESLSHAYGVPAPFGKGAFFARCRWLTQRLPACGSWRRRRLRDSQLALSESTDPCGKGKVF